MLCYQIYQNGQPVSGIQASKEVTCAECKPCQCVKVVNALGDILWTLSDQERREAAIIVSSPR